MVSAPPRFAMQDSIGEIHFGEKTDLDPDRCLDSCCGLSLPPSRSSKGLRVASFLEKAEAVPVRFFFLFLELALVADPDDSVHDSHD